MSFEQRRFPEARELLPKDVAKGLNKDTVVVLLEPTDRPSDQRMQLNNYRALGYNNIAETADGIFMAAPKKQAEGYAKHAAKQSSDMLKAPPKKSGLDNETDTLQTVRVTPQSLLDGKDD